MEEATIMGTMEHTTMDKEEATMMASKKNVTTPGKHTINKWISSINSSDL